MTRSTCGCPRCGVIGTPVARHTVAAHVPPEAAGRLSDTAYFCSNPRCNIAYYDALEQWLPIDLLDRSIFPKDPMAPICSCFGMTAQDVEADAKAGRTDRIKQLIVRAQTTDARCDELAPNGCSCVPEIQRHYLKCSRKM